MKTQPEAYYELENLSNEFAALIKAGINPESDTVKNIAKRMNDLQRLYFKPSPFRVGKSYELMNGQTVIIVGVSNRGTDYECICDQFGHYRYSTRDFGRSTGTDGMSYDQFIDLSKVDMTGFEYPSWWKVMKKEEKEPCGDGYERYSLGMINEDGREVPVKIFDRDNSTFLVEYEDQNDDKRVPGKRILMGSPSWIFHQSKFWISVDKVKFSGGSTYRKKTSCSCE